MNTIQQPKSRKQRKQEKELAYLLDEELPPRNTTKRRKASPDEHLKRSYGITLEEKLAMLQSQHCHCAICYVKLDANVPSSFVVDHCHTTGAIRGILCNPCNLMLGHARDHEQILLNAAEYIKASKLRNV